MMTYFPSEQWTDKLFSMGSYGINKNEFLIPPSSYKLLKKLAKENLGDRPITQVSFGPDYDEYLLELSKQHGIFLLSEPKYKQDQDLGDNLLVVPMFTEHNTPTDVWIIDLDNQTYDGIPLSDDYDGSVYDFYKLGKPFVFKVENFFRKHYNKDLGYDAINKRRVF
jgi:hypothetical protein